MTCNECLWFVNDCEKLPDVYKHELAKRSGVGFCLMMDLFTYVNPKNGACNDFNLDEEKRKCRKC